MTTYRSMGKWNAVLTVTALIGLIVMVFAGDRLMMLHPLGQKSRTNGLRYVGRDALRLTMTNDAEVDRTTARVRAVGPSPYLVFEPADPASPIRNIRIGLQPIQPLSSSAFYVYFVPAREPGGSFNETNKVLGLSVSTPERWILDWELPQSAALWRLDIPRGADFRLDYVEFGGIAPPWAEMPPGTPLSAVLRFCAAVALIGIALQLFWRRFVPGPRTIKTVLILGWGTSAALLAFLLPPFQGPDENGHWKIALSFYRRDIAHEPSAYYLPEALRTGTIPFHQDVRFKAEALRALSEDRFRNSDDVAASHRYLMDQYLYVRLHSYPILFLLFQVFPPVTTVQQALQLFYLSRLIPALLGVTLLYVLNRRYELPYTALFFLSLPLVVQQFVVISADTLLNLGTVVAVLLFLKLRERQRWPLLVALWALCLAIAGSKFIAAGVLVLPLLLIPYRRIPRPTLVLVAFAVLLLPAVYVVGTMVLSSVRDVGGSLHRTAVVEGQIVFLRSWAGFKTFLGAWAAYWGDLAGVGFWSGPLGWLDTPLSPQHVSLIGASGLGAFVLDVWRYGPRLFRTGRSRGGEVALLAALSVGAFVFATFSNSMLFYLMTSAVGAKVIVGSQVRHLFAAAILMLMLPLAVLDPDADDDGDARPDAVVADTLAITLLTSLLIACTIELSIDVLSRYWG